MRAGTEIALLLGLAVYAWVWFVMPTLRLAFPFP
jgi:hypothetical protein